jgi:hypothetical protein
MRQWLMFAIVALSVCSALPADAQTGDKTTKNDRKATSKASVAADEQRYSTYVKLSDECVMTFVLWGRETELRPLRKQPQAGGRGCLDDPAHKRVWMTQAELDHLKKLMTSAMTRPTATFGSVTDYYDMQITMYLGEKGRTYTYYGTKPSKEVEAVRQYLYVLARKYYKF